MKSSITFPYTVLLHQQVTHDTNITLTFYNETLLRGTFPPKTGLFFLAKTNLE